MRMRRSMIFDSELFMQTYFLAFPFPPSTPHSGGFCHDIVSLPPINEFAEFMHDRRFQFLRSPNGSRYNVCSTASSRSGLKSVIAGKLITRGSTRKTNFNIIVTHKCKALTIRIYPIANQKYKYIRHRYIPWRMNRFRKFG
ncbi:8156444a-e270-423c-a65a-bc84e5e88dbe-CDS [Sclerotinia trifoliorum]|uniref:8156444a-e270-423c-a65a-bc84e5e88dbe-CDS n=1 Tax=Sclerotinia trifoliorum TaxID=28548 RepID=A0A8H2VQB9_9HELO|nr:8156444a-e270-423c-a65a-bc84e5e88dbe-CDS [Sclerotinia trifoliorum]